MLKKPKNTLEALPEFTEEENNWCICVLAQPGIKPKRAAILFVHRFDRFLEIPVDKDDHPDIEGEYYPADTVEYSVIKKFYYFRSDPNAANYKSIQRKKALYNEVFRDLIDTYLITDLFELLNYMEEVYLDVREHDKTKYTFLKDAANIRDKLYQPKVQHEEEAESDNPNAGGWHTSRAPRRAEFKKTKTEYSNS